MSTTNQIKISDNTATSDVIRFNIGSTIKHGDIYVGDPIGNDPYFYWKDFTIYPYGHTYISCPPLCYKHEFRMEQKEGKLVISIDLPGVRLQDITLSLDGNNLSLNAVRQEPVETISKTYFVLGNWDLGSAQASLENGVLSITFSRKKQNNKKEIKIQEKK